jgi:anti-anti-sigma regulatory factor
MDVTTEQGVRLSDDGGLLTLPLHLDIGNAQSIHEAMCTALRTAAALHIDGGAVTRVDGAGVQVLCALFATARRRGFSVHWRSVSPSLADAARRLGVHALIAIDLPRPEGH